MAAYVKPVTWILGVVFVVVGVAGFLTDGNLLGFQVDSTHNIVHIVSGVVALLAASTGQSNARWYLVIFGLVYGLVTVLGFMTGSVLGLFEVNAADNYLHLAIAAVSLIVGLGGGK